MPSFARDCKIFAKKLLEIESSRDKVSLSIGSLAEESSIKDSIAYSLARVINILVILYIIILIVIVSKYLITINKDKEIFCYNSGSALYALCI